MTKKIYKVEGMHCVSCALVIEEDLADAGVKAHCSYAKQTLEVEYDKANIQEQVIKKTVVSSGYRIIE